eukprot:Sro387_g132050.2  (640) ;mRNA; r:21435-23354
MTTDDASSSPGKDLEESATSKDASKLVPQQQHLQTPHCSTTRALGGIFTVDQITESGIDATALSPRGAPQPPAAVPGAFHVVGRESTTHNMPPEGSLHLDNTLRRPPRQTEQNTDSQPGAFSSSPNAGSLARGSNHSNSNGRGGSVNPLQLLEDTGLVRARRISDQRIHGSAEPVDLEAQEATRQERKNMSNLKITAGLCTVVLVIIVVVVAYYLASGGGNNTDTDVAKNQPLVATANNETRPPEDINNSTIMMLDLPMELPQATIDTILQDVNGTTPQYKAYKWIQQDPYLANYSHDETRLRQRFAAATFYHATNGETWTEQGGGTVTITIDAPNNNALQQLSVSGAVTVVVNVTSSGTLQKVNITSEPWLSYGTHECSWFNTATKASKPFCRDGTFENFDIGKNNLTGTIPDEIGLLTTAKAVKLGWSMLQGTLPTQFGVLTNLEELRVFRSEVRGIIPSELGLLSDTLEQISLIQNRLTGSLPSELWQLTNVDDIAANRNSLSGTLPSDIGFRMPHLRRLRANDNQLSGVIPSSLGLCTDLTVLDLAKNQLTSSIPSEFGSLGLKELVLEYNIGIQGSLPEELGQLNDTLQVLLVTGTSLEGEIPADLCPVEELEFDCSPSNSSSPALCGCDCACG